MKSSLIFHALNVNSALGNRQRSILGCVNRELVEDNSKRSDLVCADWNSYPHEVGAFLASGAHKGQENGLNQRVQGRWLCAREGNLVRWPG
jgi:hypothetical protein